MFKTASILINYTENFIQIGGILNYKVKPEILRLNLSFNYSLFFTLQIHLNFPLLTFPQTPTSLIEITSRIIFQPPLT